MRPRHSTAFVAVGLVLLLGAPLAWQAGRQDADFGEAPPVPTAPGRQAPAGGTMPSPPPSREASAAAVATSSARLSDAGHGLHDDPASEPVRVLIPSQGVDAEVRPVGAVAGTGELEIPEDARTAGWYRHGAAPGASRGSAVLSSHVDTRRHGPGAFFRLAEFDEGAEVTVVLADGTAATYRVRARQRYEKALLPAADLFARDGEHRLVLITCGGPFDAGARRYRDNVVVIAEPAPGA